MFLLIDAADIFHLPPPYLFRYPGNDEKPQRLAEFYQPNRPSKQPVFYKRKLLFLDDNQYFPKTHAPNLHITKYHRIIVTLSIPLQDIKEI
jgi:hypothetical protein